MMNEVILIVAIVVAGVSGLPGLLTLRDDRSGERLATGLITLAGVLASVAAVSALVAESPDELGRAWHVPGGRFGVHVDALSAMFILQIAVLSVLGAWFGLEYWPQRDHPQNGRKLRVFYGTVTAGMLLLVVARNGVLFLAGWETMALSAFFLLSTEDDKPIVRSSGFFYLLAAHAGTLCLLAMFAVFEVATGTLDLDAWPAALASPLRDAIFVLALCGFGLKAGLMPLHVWLPGAHANAPSHVSALMSGVLIKMGIYGLVRLTAACDAPPLWWGETLIVAGAVSGVLGVAFAIGQHDLKRLLAYHSVENIGIIVMGLGVAVLGRSLGRPELVALGFAGAMLHVWNHGLFKGLLFLSAGSVLHATGTREIDRLGGLLRRMPLTGLAFLVGAVAICGLPPLNGLISELFVYLGLFRTATLNDPTWLAGGLAAPALALIGALAVACFVKVFGVVFLGQPRTPDVSLAHEAGPLMLVPMALLAATCVFIGVGAPLVAPVLDAAVAAWVGTAAAPLPTLGELAPLLPVSAISAVLLVAILLAGAWIVRASRATPPPELGTWDCGYASPSPRMQYTASSFADLIVDLTGWVLRPLSHVPRLDRVFPSDASFHSHVPDIVLDKMLIPAFSIIRRIMTWLHLIQHGKLHIYLLYILGIVIALLFWWRSM